MELGLATFADVHSGVSPETRLAQLMEEAELADQLGLDVFAVGEHHRPDFAVSAPAVVLAAAAMRTKAIRLSSAVTVLSSDDPVRVFQQFATLDLLSGGRAEIMAGRGSFIESFPLFGQDLEDYDDLYAEKLELLLRLREGVEVTWSGRHRAPLTGQGVYPRPVQDPLPCGSPSAARRVGRARRDAGPAADDRDHRRRPRPLRAARRALPRGGPRAGTPRRRCAWPSTPRVRRRDAQEADRAFAGPYLAGMNRIGRERGWPPSGPAQYAALKSPGGAPARRLARGDREKILYGHELFGHQRYVGQMSVGAVAHADVSGRWSSS
jgi:alkanesulfonate monooxygenase SsuD/methylene tetrahydromethanopterin reductase-like flavin-dependent oxidoreductase (luciferase family)